MKFDLTSDIKQALTQYPSLQLMKDTDSALVEGEIIFSKLKHNFDDSFKVSLKFPHGYPFRFPNVEEIGKRIPRNANRHVNGNGNLCFGAEPEELITCSGGITLHFFIEKILIPHLAREVYVEVYRKYPHGERPHGRRAGNMDFYYELLNSFDTVLVLKILCYIASDRVPHYQDKCFCGSEFKLFECHFESIEKLKKLPRAYIINEIKEIYTMLNL